MKKLQVYLGKSNHCDPDVVMQVRKLLKSIPVVEVVEFRGGQYSAHDLLHSDFLLVLPHIMTNEMIMLGKGLSSQITEFPHQGNILIVSAVDKTSIRARRFHHQNIIEKDWSENWSECFTEGPTLNLMQGLPIAEKIANGKEDLKQPPSLY